MIFIILPLHRAFSPDQNGLFICRIWSPGVKVIKPGSLEKRVVRIKQIEPCLYKEMNQD